MEKQGDVVDRRVARFGRRALMMLVGIHVMSAVASTPVQLDGVLPGAHAIVLKFLGTGASAYDIRHLVASSTTSCASAGSPQTWTVAARSTHAKPAASGVQELFPIRPLAANTEWCVAIRAQYKNIWSAWTVWPSRVLTTDGGGESWPFMVQASTATTRQVFDHAEYVDSGEPVVAWSLWDNAIGGRSPNGGITWANGSQGFGLGALITKIDALDAAANNGSATGGTGLLANGFRLEGSGRNAANVNRYVLVEAASAASTPTTSVVVAGKAVTGGVDNGGDGALEYVLNNGNWRPAVAADLVITKSSAGKTSGLFMHERSGSTWVRESAAVLERSGADQSDGFFSDYLLLTLPAGSDGHSTLALAAPHCGMTVYAERSGGFNGVWRYFDAGPMPTGTFRGGKPLQLSRDPVDGDVVLSWKPTYNGTSPLMFARRQDFSPLPGRPAANCAGVVPNSGVARQVVPVSPADPLLSHAASAGVIEVGSAQFAAVYRSEPNNKAMEYSLAFRCTFADTWQYRKVDASHGGVRGLPVAGADGSIRFGYTWGLSGGLAAASYITQPADVLYVSSGMNPCPGGL